MGFLLWRLGVAPEAFACLNVTSTLELVAAKAKKYNEPTPAVVMGNRSLTDRDILRLAEGLQDIVLNLNSVPGAGNVQKRVS